MKHGKWEQAEVTEEEVINRGLGGRGRTRRTAHNRTVQRAISRAFSSSLFLCVCLSCPPAPFSDLTRTHKSTKCKKQKGNDQLSLCLCLTKTTTVTATTATTESDSRPSRVHRHQLCVPGIATLTTITITTTTTIVIIIIRFTNSSSKVLSTL